MGHLSLDASIMKNGFIMPYILGLLGLWNYRFLEFGGEMIFVEFMSSYLNPLYKDNLPIQTEQTIGLEQ